MQNLNLNQVKHLGLVAVLIPVGIFALFQLMANTLSFYHLILLATLAVATIGSAIYYFNSSLETMKWQYQLSTLIQKVSAPVLIADQQHGIIYANDNFYRLPLARLLSQVSTLPEFLKKIATQAGSEQTDDNFDTLKTLHGKIKLNYHWKNEHYCLIISGLDSPLGKRFGTLVECIYKEHANANVQQPTHDECSKQVAPREEPQPMMLNSSHPLAIVDIKGNIKKSNPASLHLFPQLVDVKHICSLLDKSHPTIQRLKKALLVKMATTFVMQQDDKIYDVEITPIKDNHEHVGYIIEWMYPSKQEMKAFEEGWQRWQQHYNQIEKEMAKFTRGLGKLNLYQKEGVASVDQFKAEDYRHPLLKNSTKIAQQLGGCIHKLYGKIDGMKQEKSAVQIAPPVRDLRQAVPLSQINMIASTISRNVNEIKFDFEGLNESVVKLKSLTKEQKGLQKAYNEPIVEVLSSIEQALHQAVNHSQTLTLVLQGLHENQVCLEKFQQFSSSVNDLTKHSVSGASQIPKEMIAFVDDIKQAIAASVERLRGLLIDFDGVRHHWRHSIENLQGCLHLSNSVDNASNRWKSISDKAQETIQQLQIRMLHVNTLVEKIHEKSIGSDSIAHCREFDKVILGSEQDKRRAEDVLLEGFETALPNLIKPNHN